MSSELTDFAAHGLSPSRIPVTLRQVSAFEALGWLNAEEADAWRFFLAAWYGYHGLSEACLSSEWEAFWTRPAAARPPARETHFAPADSDAA